MTDMDDTRSDLAAVLERFPEAAIPIRRMFLADRGFRSICEDYALARETLARFQAMPDAPQRPEIADYLSVIAGLEGEIIAFVRDAGAAMEILDR